MGTGVEDDGTGTKSIEEEKRDKLQKEAAKIPFKSLPYTAFNDFPLKSNLTNKEIISAQAEKRKLRDFINTRINPRQHVESFLQELKGYYLTHGIAKFSGLTADKWFNWCREEEYRENKKKYQSTLSHNDNEPLDSYSFMGGIEA